MPILLKWREKMDRENSHMAPLKRENYVERKKYVAIKISDKQYVKFRRDRVNKLRELYEKCIPEVEKKWVLPAGETDGRKAVVVEKVLGEDVSPFDLPEFDSVMPHFLDYIEDYKYKKE